MMPRHAAATLQENAKHYLKYWKILNDQTPQPWAVYAGDISQTRKHAEIVGCENIAKLCQRVT